MITVGLGDLLNLDYGYALDGGPMWDFGTAGYSLSGPEMSTDDILGAQFGMGPMRGTDYTFGVGGIDDQAMRPSVFEVNASGQHVPLGFRGTDGMVQTLGGFPVAPNPFGIDQSGGLPLANLRDALSNLARAGGPGAGSGGGGNLGIAMPRVESPVTERIGAVPVPPIQTGAIPAAPPVPEYHPSFQPVPLAQGPDGDMRGLERLLRGAR